VQVVELLLQKPTIPAPKGYKPSQFHGEVELRDVVFSYPTRPLNPVLNGLNLKIDSGITLHLRLPPIITALSDCPAGVCKGSEGYAVIIRCAAPRMTGEVVALVGPSGGGKSSIV
jgi:ABC-type multidrug transport system fused ATPase/permease subunit